MPISLRTWIACGRTEAGDDQAEETFTPSGARERAIPSAIWLRAEFATQRNRMCCGFIDRSSATSVLQSPERALIRGLENVRGIATHYHYILISSYNDLTGRTGEAIIESVHLTRSRILRARISMIAGFS